LAVLVTLLVLPDAGTQVAGADFTVLNTGDAGADTLRAVITAANADPASDDMIHFSAGLAGQTINLGSMLPMITKSTGSLTITGLGTGQLTISGQNLHRIFFVNGGNVTIEDLALSGGLGQGGQGGDAGDDLGGAGGGGLGAGGAVFVNGAGNVVLRNVDVANNTAAGGDGGGFDGGIFLGHGGGGGGGLGGDGGDGGERGGGGGGGFGGDGADGPNAPIGFAGSGGGGLSEDGIAALQFDFLGGAGGGAEGGDGGNQGSDGQGGQNFGGGGGAGFGRNGGEGGDFGGGGGGDNNGGVGGFGGGGGGGPILGGNGGFGGGDGGGDFEGGDGGDAFGGAIFVRNGGTLILENVNTSGNATNAGSGGDGFLFDGNGGSTDGTDFYLHGTQTTTIGGDQNSLLNGSIGGTGGVTKTGAGTATLSGTNTYTGATSVNQGVMLVNGSLASTVTVASGGTFGGNGTIAGLVLNGTIAPGNSIGTTNISGDATLNSGSTTEIEINDAGTTPGINNDLIAATGDVTINGGTVQVVANPGTYTAGTTYTFITANSVNGVFDSITDDLAFFNALLIYNAGSVQFELMPNMSDFAAVAVTGNQTAVARYIDDNSSTPSPELQAVIDELLMLTNEQLQQVLDQLSGGIYGSLSSANLQHTTYYLSQLAERLRSGLAAAGSGGIAGTTSPNDSYAWDDGQLIVRGQSCCPALRTAVSGYGLGGTADSDGNADGFRYALGGTQIAIDQSLSDLWRAGLWANLAWGNVRSQTLNEQADIENYHFGGYLVGSDGTDYYLGIAGLGFDDAEVRRRMIAGNTMPVAAGNYDGWQAATYLERGRSVCHRGWNLQPYVAGQYIYQHQGALIETGAGTLNLNVGDLDVYSLRSVFGGRISRVVINRTGGALTPELRAAWLHEFLDTNQVVNGSFAGVGGAGFAVDGVDLGRDWITTGAGLNLLAHQNVRFFGGYDLQVNDRQAFHVGSGGMELLW
jgi:autotransporter-associated beta strand protein